jgi:uncharacterized membrane protein HdeD (DUF308 family)
MRPLEFLGVFFILIGIAKLIYGFSTRKGE